VRGLCFVINRMKEKRTIRILVNAILMAVVAAAMWNQQALDRRIAVGHNFIYDIPAYRYFFEFFTDYGMSIISLIIGMLLFFVYGRPDTQSYQRLCMCVLLSLILGAVASPLLKLLFARERPIIDLAEAIRLTSISHSYAFPSGHATKSMALALPYVILATGRNFAVQAARITILVIGLLVCYSRVALQRHYLSDVLAGIALAIFCMLSSYRIVQWYTHSGRHVGAPRWMTRPRWGMVFMGLTIIFWVT